MRHDRESGHSLYVPIFHAAALSGLTDAVIRAETDWADRRGAGRIRSRVTPAGLLVCVSDCLMVADESRRRGGE